MRRAAKVDANQAPIVDRLRKVGVQVEIVGKPLDLLLAHLVACPSCGHRTMQTVPAEVKNPDGKDRITKEQAEFIAKWPAPIYFFRNEDEAVRAVLGEAMA